MSSLDAAARGLVTAPSVPRRGRVEHVMGTAVSLDLRDEDVPEAALDDVFEFLRDVERRFSPFRPESEVGRLIAGELAESEASDDLRLVLGLAEDLRRTTGGYFDIRRHRPDGRPDPTGLVKGWAVETAAWRLEDAGATRFAVNAGGDVITRGEPEPGRPWRVGIRHPDRVDAVVAVVGLRDGAMATSGAYERGQHITDPHTGRPPEGLASLSVVGPSLTWADAYATAAFAMGPAGIAWVGDHPGYGAYGVTADRRAAWTPLLDGLLLRD
jgi:thiamine biosynthesis lipoprotein